MGKWGGVEGLGVGRGRLGGGNGEREMEKGATGRGRWEGGNRKEETGKGAKGRGRRRGKRRGDFTDGLCL